jgi:hypothetical protein
MRSSIQIFPAFAFWQPHCLLLLFDCTLKFLTPTVLFSSRFRTFCRAPACPLAAAIVATAWSSWTLPPATLPIHCGNTPRFAAVIARYCCCYRRIPNFFESLLHVSDACHAMCLSCFLTNAQLTSISLSNNSFGRIHVFAEIFDIVLRSNHSVCTVWCNNNVFTGM